MSKLTPSIHEAERLRELLRYTHEIAKVGTWERDFVHNRVWWSDEFRALLHVDPDEPASLDGLLARIHLDDRAEFAQRLAEAYRCGGSHHQDFRVLRPDGLVCRFQSRVRVECDAEGRPARAMGTIQDVTIQVAVEEELRRQTAYLTAILNHLPQGISVFDEQLRLQYWNSKLAEVLGLPDELLYRNVRFEDLIQVPARRGEYGPGDPETLAKELVERARHPRPHSFERVRPDGSVIHVRGQPLADGGFVTVYNDVTELKQAEHGRLLADKVFENTPEAIVIIDLSRRIVSANPAFRDITGLEPQAVVGEPFVPGEDSANGGLDCETIWQILEKQGNFIGETIGMRADGTPYPRALTMTTVRNQGSGPITHFIAIFTDITERKRNEADIQHLAHHDTLTGLANRFSLYARLEQSIADAKRNGQSLAVLFLDLDRFKNINDSLGHHVGDALLVQVGQRLREAVREADTVARLGGDEFVVVLQGVATAGGAAHVAGELLKTLSAAYTVDGIELHAIPSIGISLYPDDSTTPSGLLRNADAAMYHAKALGRGNYQFFTEELNRAATARLKLESQLRRAVVKQEFELWYQPLFDAADNRLTAFEALIRWRQPDGALIPPDRFIPLAEETGIIVALGDWVIREACSQLMRWRSLGLRDIRMSVNLSARQLRDRRLPETVAAVLRDSDIPPEHLELEITESSIMEHPTEAIELLGALKASGVGIAIDDFGTGYSSLSYLKLFPLDRLKIDRSFVSDIETDPNDSAIVTAAVSLAHNLGLKVIAEGVESAIQVSRLREIGCDELQGYHFSKPLPAREAEAFARKIQGGRR